MKSSADITVTNKRSDNFLYQTILISPSKRSEIRFFTLDKYDMGRQVDDLLSTIYLGDGENIFFREKQKYRNQYIIKYEILEEVEIDLSDRKFHVSGNVPNHDGCDFCKYHSPSIRGQSQCKFYKKFLKRKKIYCTDFQDKE